MAGLDRSAKIYNSVYGIEVNDKEMLMESARLYREQVIKTEAYKNASDQMKRFIMGSFTGSVIENGDPNLISAIPAIDTNKLSSVMSSDTMYVASKEKVSDFVDTRKKSLFDDFAFKVSKGSSLQKNKFFTGIINNAESSLSNGMTIQYETVTKGYNIAQTSQQALAAIENAKRNGFVSWDLETMAGNRIQGPSRYPGAITEFSFISYGANGQKGKTFNAIIGANENELLKYEDIYKRLQNGTGFQRGRLIGNYFTDEEAVTIERLALAGNSVTQLDRSRQAQGILAFKSFASKEDLAIGGYNIEDIRRGIDLYKEAFKIQGSANKTFAWNNAGKQMQFGNLYGWETELLGGLGEIASGKTALGYNSKQFDISRLRHLVASHKTSQGFRDAIQAMFGNSFDMKYHLDALAIARQNLDPTTIYTNEQLKELRQHNLTGLTQEGLVRRVTSKTGKLFADSAYEDKGVVAHLARTDTEMLAKFALDSGLLNDNATGNNAILKDIYKDLNATQKNLGTGDLIFAKNYVDPDKSNLLMMFKDPDTGALITHDNLVIDPKTGKIIEDKFNKQMGMQRGTFYKIEGISKLNKLSEEQIKDLEEIYPHLANQDLYTIKLNQFYNPKELEDFEKTARSRGSIYYTGTIDDIQRMINNNTLFGGTIRSDGTIDYSNVGEDILRQFNPVNQTIDENGIGNFEYKYKKDLVGNREAIMQDAMDMASVRVQEDAAARMNRNFSYGKDVKLLELMHRMNDEVDSKLSGQIITDQERRIRIKNLEREFFENSVSINKRMLNGEDINDIKKLTGINGGNIWNRSFHDTLGFEFTDIRDETTKAGLYQSTLSSQLVRMDSIRNNEQYIRKATQLAEEWSGGDRNKANYIYGQMRRVTNEFLKYKGNYEALGYDPTAMTYAYNYENVFEVNLRGFEGIKGDTNFKVYLDNSSENLVDRLATKIGKANKYKEDGSRTLLIKDFQNFLIKKGKITSFNPNNDVRNIGDLLINNDDSSLFAINKLIRHMSTTRDINPALGHRNGTGTLGLNFNLGAEFNTVDDFEKFARENILQRHNANEFFSFVMPGGNKEKANLIAEKVADRLFSVGQKYEDDILSETTLMNKYGYSARDAKNLIRIQNIKKNNAINMMSEIFRTIGDTGGNLAIDKAGNVQAIYGDTAFNIQLVSSKFQQGQFIDRIGNRKVSLGFGLYKTGDTFKETSTIEAHMGRLKGLLNWAEGRINIHGEDAATIMSRAVSGYFSNVTVDSPAIKHVGLNARADQFRYSINDVVHNLQLVKKQILGGKYDEFIRGENDALKNLLRQIDDITGKKMGSYGGLYDFTMDDMNIVNANWLPILKAVEDQHLHIETSIGDFTPRSKYIDRGYGTIKDGNINVFTDFTGEKRHPNRFLDARINARSDAISEILQLANEENAPDTLGIKNYVSHLKGVKTNSAIMTSDMAASLEGSLQKNAFRELRLKTLNTSTDIINRKTSEALKQILDGKSTKYSVDQLRGKYSRADIDTVTQMFLEEGQAYIDGQVFDRLFNDTESIQKIEFNYNKIPELEDDFLVDLNHRASNLPMFDVTKNKFTYGSGSYVNKGEDIIHYTSQGRAVPRQAKSSGILKFGFFDDSNNLISESKINEIIGLDDNLKSVLTDNNVSVFDKQRTLFSKIQDAGLTGYFYIQNEAANPYKKLSSFYEKNMSFGLIESTGAVDKDISNVLESLGFKNVGSRHGRLIDNTLLNIDLIDSINNEAQGDFWTVASYRYNKKTGDTLTKEKFSKILEKSSNGRFKDADTFRKAILEERYRTSDLLHTLLVQAGVIGENENIHMIANNAAAIKKHKDPGAVLEAQINNLLEKNIETEAKGKKLNAQIVQNALEKTAEQFRKYIAPTESHDWRDIFSIDRNRQSLILKRSLNSVSPLTDEQLKKLGLATDGHIRGDMGEVITSIARQLDYYEQDKLGGDTVKANQRTITNLEQFRYSNKGMADAKKFLEASGHGNLFDEFINSSEDGQIVNSSAIDQIKKRLFDKGNGEMIAGYLDKDYNGNFKWGINKNAVERFVEKYGISNEAGEGVELIGSLINKASSKFGSKNFREEGVLNLYQVWTNALAASYNRGDVKTSTLEKAGFEILSIKDLMIDNDGRINNSAYGKNILIDLHDDTYGLGDQLRKFIPDNTSGDRRYLAIAYTPTSKYLERDEFVNQPQEVLRSLKMQMERYHDSLGTIGGNNTFNEEKRKQLIEDMGRTVRNLDVAQFNQFMSKKGVVAEAARAYLSDGMYNAAQGIDINANIKDIDYTELLADAQKSGTSLKDLHLNTGKNKVYLMDEAAKGDTGLQLSYTILSKDKMEAVYNKRFDNLEEQLIKQGNMSEAEAKAFSDQLRQSTIQRVETEGVSGISFREPVQYAGSVQQRQIYFSDIVKGNAAISNYAGAAMRKEDYDSDKVLNAIHKEAAEIHIGNKSVQMDIDSAMYNSLREMDGVSVKLLDSGAEDRFKNYIASNIYLGSNQAQRYRRLVEEADSTYKFDSYSADYLKDENRSKLLKDLTKLENQSVTLEDANKLYSSYLTQVEQAAGNAGERSATLFEKRVWALEELDKQAKNFTNAAGKHYNNVSEITADATGGALELYNKYKALKFGLRMDTLDADIVASTGQSMGAGMVNSYTQTISNITQRVLSKEEGAKAATEFFEAKGYKGMTAGIFSEQMTLVSIALQETMLSPKNNAATEGYFNETAINDLREAFDGLLKLGEKPQDKEQVREKLSNYIYNSLSQRPDKEILKRELLPSPLEARINGINAEGLKKYYESLNVAGYNPNDPESEMRAVRQIADSTADFLVNGLEFDGNLRKISQGIGGRSLAKGEVRDSHISSMMHGENHLAGHFASMVNEIAKESGISDGENIIREIAEAKVKSLETVQHDIDTATEEAIKIGEDITTKNLSRVTHNAGKLLSEGMESLKHNTLLGAAIGLAGGLIISGFANDPKAPPEPSVPQQQSVDVPVASPPMSSVPQPTDMLAAGASAQMPQTQQSVTLSDSNLNVMRGSKRKSYVINIAGNTNRGSAQAIQALNSSMYGQGSGQSNNGSISMAINNNYRNTLTQQQVNRMIAGAMGA